MPSIPHWPAQRLALLVGSLLLAACATQPPQLAPVSANSLAHTVPAAPEISLPPDWLTIESTVVSLGEQDLFDRLRYGFELPEIEAKSIDVEEAWYARHPDYLDRTFRRGERYLYYITSELEARNMPLELALLPVVESAFNPTAYSRAKASGLWQFIPSTGLRFGLRQNNYYDGRRDVVESTRAALDYLQFLANEFNGDWLLAVAAYNCGEMNVERAIARNVAKGKPTDYFSLDLPRETEAYVPKLLAMRRIVSEPARYGLEFGSMENQPYFVKVDVGGQIDLELAAELAGMSKEDFLSINPGFKRRVTDPNGPHELLIPVDNEQSFLAKLAALPDAQRVPVVYYRVRKGDTLSKIAKRYGISSAELRNLNQLKANSVRPGQELLLRGTASALAAADPVTAEATSRSTSGSSASKSSKGRTHVVARGETLWSIAQRYQVDPTVLAQLNGISRNAIKVGQRLRIPTGDVNSTASNISEPTGRVTYTVRAGDTLSRIANQFNVDVQQLITWNKLPSGSAIQAGQRLKLYIEDRHREGG